ncbi:MAG: acetyl-CoA carboxylase biotin carboxylase subunit [Sphingobacteriales bacterium]|jgi:acetyl-CoA carboxylase biotin carboxylase subunit
MKKILIANRGEIAIRVMRSAKEMGIKTVAVFSEADRNAPFVQYADEAVCIGPPASSESYLVIDKIIDACRKTGADAVHPGYGFLSENATFARRLEKEKITFVGPSAESMEVMGSKLAAKAAVKEYGIPLVPGTDHAIEDVPAAKEIAKEIGFPILIKASAGGGGKGMRIVKNPEEFIEQMDLAVSEAQSAFGDGAVFIERYITSPRHIEIQIIADNHGNIVHLFERECSVQRRHQKVIEEAPSAVLTPELRAEMGKCAVDVARACAYRGAGTVEFILEQHGGKLSFFFLEMNTRLQVEHPVSELITGVDLVKEQINIARGEKLSFTQDDMKINGHAMELRVYAEDPCNNFLPDIGKLVRYELPQGNGVRVDDGFREGMDIPIYYDPMIAKLITYGKDRKEAIDRMVRAIDEYKITGIETTLPFGKFVMQHEAFVSGNFDTHFVEKHFTPEKLKHEDADEMLVAALIGLKAISKPSAKAQQTESEGKKASNWKTNRVQLR